MGIILSAGTSQFISDLPTPSGTTFSAGTTELLSPLGPFITENIRSSTQLQNKINSGDIILKSNGNIIYDIESIGINDFKAFSGYVKHNTTIEANLTVTGNTTSYSVSATTISGGTFYGDGSNLIGISTDNFYATGSTLIGSTAYFDRNDTLSAFTLDLSSLDVNDTFVTGGTFSDVSDTITLTRNDGSDINITGITDNYTTGSTLIGSTAYFDRNDTLSAFTLDLSSLDVNDTFVTGGTFSDVSDTITLTRNDGANINITGITDKYTTGSTLIGSTLYFDRNDVLSAYTTDLSSLLDDTNFYATGSTLIGSTAYFDRSDTLSAFTLDLSSLDVNDTFVTGGTFSDVSDTITLTRNDGVDVNITGIVDYYTTGSTLIGSTLYFDRNDSLSAYTANLSSLLDDTNFYTTGSTLIGSTAYFDRSDTLSAFTLDLSSLDVNDTFVTGGTFSDATDTITLTRNDGANVNITGIVDYYTTGSTLIGSTLYFDRTDTLSAYTTDLSSLLDDTNFYTTGSTLIGSTAYFDRTDTLSAFTLDLSSLLDDTNFYATGATLIGSTAYFDRNDTLSAFTLDLSSLDVNDTFVTGGTISGSSNLVFTRNDATKIITDLTITRNLTFNAEMFALGSASKVTLSPPIVSAIKFGGVGSVDDSGISFTIPEDYKSGGEIYIVWRTSSTSTTLSAKTFFDVYTGNSSNTGSLLTSVETLSILDTPESTANVYIYSDSKQFSTYKPKSGDNVHFRVYRDPNDIDDTLSTGDLNLINLIFKYDSTR